MIKVIVSDLDGTLLGEDHQIAPKTLDAVRKAQGSGIRFMIATGRNYPGAMEALKGTGLTCDLILSSGAEIRDPSGRIVGKIPLDRELCREIYSRVCGEPIIMVLFTDERDYRIGTALEAEEQQLEEFQVLNTVPIPDLQKLEEENIPVYKMFLCTDDIPVLGRVKKNLEGMEGIALASSFDTNLEITDARAQKGPVLKEYIQSLGYEMEEIMVLGDSLNDYSMLSMEFGATIAMANADQKLKEVARFETLSNEELGVAAAICQLLERQQDNGFPCGSQE